MKDSGHSVHVDCMSQWYWCCVCVCRLGSLLLALTIMFVIVVEKAREVSMKEEHQRGEDLFACKRDALVFLRRTKPGQNQDKKKKSDTSLFSSSLCIIMSFRSEDRKERDQETLK